VIVVQNPSHFDRSLVGDRFAADTPFFPLRSLLEAGIPIAIGSDGPLNPFLNVMLAAIHPMRPTEALTREQAVQAYTSGSAFAEFAEADKGTLGVGKSADLAVLSGDLFAMPVQQLPTLRSVLTILGGEIVYDAHVLDHAGSHP
jgi:predicted amidohydrolase YtcJ